MNESGPSPSRTWLWTTVVIVILPVIYALSIGPVIYWMERHRPARGPDPWLQTFYGPLLWADEHTPLKKPLDVYTDWWVRLAHKT